MSQDSDRKTDLETKVTAFAAKLATTTDPQSQRDLIHAIRSANDEARSKKQTPNNP